MPFSVKGWQRIDRTSIHEPEAGLVLRGPGFAWLTVLSHKAAWKWKLCL